MIKFRFGRWANEFLSGKITPEQESALKQWDNIDHHSTCANDNLVEHTSNQMKANIDERLSKISSDNKKSKQIWIVPAWKAAAVILVMLCVGIYLSSEHFATLNTGKLVYENTSAVPLKKVLADGSTVWLNSQTKLTVSNDFNLQQRQVSLEGEAFFEVTRNPEKPFIVNAGKIQTRVLGTSFNVKAYAEDDLYEVLVAEGSVLVKSDIDLDLISNLDSNENTNEFVLTRDEKLSFQLKENTVHKKSEQKTETATAWKENRFVYDNVPVGTVFKEISRKYDVLISPKDSALLNCTIRLDISGQSLDTMLDMVCRLIDSEYEKNGDHVTVIGAGCPKPKD